MLAKVPLVELVAAGVTGTSPYVLQEASSGRFSQVSVCWLLFTVASGLQLQAEPTRNRSVRTGILLAITSFFLLVLRSVCPDGADLIVDLPRPKPGPVGV